MTLNLPNSRSRDFDIKYLENGERYDVGLKGGQIGTAHGLSIGTMTFDLE